MMPRAFVPRLSGPHTGSALAVLVALSLLSACGFTPMYSANTPVAAQLSGVEVQTNEGRDSYLLGVALRDRLGVWQGERALYTLQTRTAPARVSTALTVDQVASRVLLTFNVDYALYDRASGAQVQAGRVTGQAAYDVPGEPYAAVRAESEAAERAASDAADRLVIVLARHFREQAAGAS